MNIIICYENESLIEKTIIFNDDRAATNSRHKNNKQNQFILSITKNLIIRCNLPLNFVEHAGFRRFLKKCNFKPELVSARKLKYVFIASFMNTVLEEIHETLTIDEWLHRRCRSYLGITCHFIDHQMKPKKISY
jgi:hypothetical protein